MLHKGGLTVVEIMVLVVIVAILASIIIPAFHRADPYSIDLSNVSDGPGTASGANKIALFFCLDVSPSMDIALGGKRKIDISIEALDKVLDQVAAYAKDHPNKEVKVGLCTFDATARIVSPLGPLDKARIMKTVRAAAIGSGTAVGAALLQAIPPLVVNLCDTRAVLLLTDGESNSGEAPERVVEAIKANRNSKNILTADIDVFLIAFDVQADTFEEVKTAGATVVESRDQRSLESVMNTLVEQVLLEAP